MFSFKNLQCSAFRYKHKNTPYLMQFYTCYVYYYSFKKRSKHNHPNAFADVHNFSKLVSYIEKKRVYFMISLIVIDYSYELDTYVRTIFPLLADFW